MSSPAFRCLVLLAAALCLFAAACSSNPSSSTPVSIPAPAVTMTPSTLAFASQMTGTTSTAQNVTLKNTGNAALAVTSIHVTGDFAQNNKCGSSVAVGANCTIAVTFTPSVVGTRSGSLSVADDATGSPQNAALSGTGGALQPMQTGCTETKNKAFPSCFALSSPTAIAGQNASSGKPGKANPRRPRKNALANDSGSSFQTAFSSDTAQISALLNGSDPNPLQTIGTLGMNAFTGAVVSQPGGFCFDPGFFYANDPEAQGSFLPNGQMPGAGGIWTATDSNGQACAAAELNVLMNAASGFSQLGLAIAAQMNFMAASNLPTAAGDSYDETAAINGGLQAAGGQAGPFQSVQLATVQFDGTGYLYTVQFTALDFSTNYTGTIMLTQTPGGGQYSYSGILQFGLDDGTTVTAGTARYERTSQTNLNISARATYYPHGQTPTLDSTGELDPSASWISSFSRFGASFDPTSSYLTGNYVYAFQGNAPGASGPQLGGAWVFQVIQRADGTGSAFYGLAADNTPINDPTVWQIDHTTCLHMGTTPPVEHRYAQFQPFEFDPSGGQYKPSSTLTAQVRYAPTSNCQWTDAQWNQGTDSNSFWYDRTLQYSKNLPTDLPVTPSPVPQYVVADPNDPNYPFSLFGDDVAAVQTKINAAGFTMPTLF
jgi:hypothetical protein